VFSKTFLSYEKQQCSQDTESDIVQSLIRVQSLSSGIEQMQEEGRHKQFIQVPFTIRK